MQCLASHSFGRVFFPGDFTCKVTDWNETETKSIHIRVVPIPYVEITPLSLTVEPESSVTISCLSRNDDQADFTYRWLRDGEDLNSKQLLNEEMVEDNFPIAIGSKLQLRRVVTPAVYTCEITSPLGTVHDDSKITVFLGR